MSSHPLIDIAGNIGAGFSNGVAAYQGVQNQRAEKARQDQEQKRSAMKEALGYLQNQGASMVGVNNEAAISNYEHILDIARQLYPGLIPDGVKFEGAPKMRVRAREEDLTPISRKLAGLDTGAGPLDHAAIGGQGNAAILQVLQQHGLAPGAGTQGASLKDILGSGAPKLGYTGEAVTAPKNLGEVLSKGLNPSPGTLPDSLAPDAPLAVEDGRDFSGSATTRVLASLYGIKPPQARTEIKPFNANDGLMEVTTNPDGTVSYSVKREPTAKASTTRPVQDPVTGTWFTPQPGMTTHTRPTKTGSGKSSKADSKVRWQTKTVRGADGKNRIFLFNPVTLEMRDTGKLAGSQGKQDGGDDLGLDDPPAATHMEAGNEWDFGVGPVKDQGTLDPYANPYPVKPPAAKPKPKPQGGGETGDAAARLQARMKAKGYI